VSVAHGRTTGLYLYGAGGLGKSHTIHTELKRLAVPYQSYNSKMSGRGLFDALSLHPSRIHVLEDAEPLFRDADALGVLRSALWGSERNSDGRLERPVTWYTHTERCEFVFTGGILLTGNREFSSLPELTAIKTRIAYLHLTASDDEIAAMMRRLALDGYRSANEEIVAAKCLEICDYLVHQCRELGRSLDLRILQNSYQDYLQWFEFQSLSHWTALVRSRLQAQLGPAERGGMPTRRDEKQEELDLAHRLRLIRDRQAKLRIWQQATGKSQSAMYRRIKQVSQMRVHLSLRM